MSKILTLHKHRPKTALKNLNRLTGLDFQSWPESLIDRNSAGTDPQESEDTDQSTVAQRVSRQG